MCETWRLITHRSVVVRSELPVLTVYMVSDNDDEDASPSGSGCASPVPAIKSQRTASVSKGILVHNTKKSANTNRVSFVTNSSSTASSQPSPAVTTPSSSAKRSKNPQHQQPQQQTAADLLDDPTAPPPPYYARNGRRLTGFGVKSHLHEFYDDPDNRRDSFQVRILKCHRVLLLLTRIFGVAYFGRLRLE